MSRESQSHWTGPALWFLWGALMGFGLLGIFSIGIPILIVGLGLLIALSNSRLAGAWMALTGAATPWAIFAAEGFLSPNCARGITTISPSGEEHFRCDLMQSASEFAPFLVISFGIVILGLVLFLLSRRGRSEGRSFRQGP